MRFYRIEMVQKFSDSPTQYLDMSYAETLEEAEDYALRDIKEMSKTRDINSPWYYRILEAHTGYDNWMSSKVKVIDWCGNEIPNLLLHIGWHYEKDGGPPVLDELHTCPDCRERELKILADHVAENTQ